MIVCGHSLGAGAALGLAARRRSMDALALLAPGHFPERLAAQALTSTSLSLARGAVAAADERRLALLDCNQGLCRRLRVRPTSYLSYFEPQGPAQWPANARAIAAPLPILMLVGRRDPAYSLGIDYAFAHTPHHPRSEYIEIDADHADTLRLGQTSCSPGSPPSNRIQDHDRPSPACRPIPGPHRAPAAARDKLFARAQWVKVPAGTLLFDDHQACEGFPS